VLLNDCVIIVIFAATKVEGLFSIPVRWQDVLDMKRWFARLTIDGEINTKYTLEL
jgi:hypothetical protein